MTVRKGNNVIAGGNSITVDNVISAQSPNPVQNSAIANALAQKQEIITAGNGITITGTEVAVGNLDCGTM